MVNLMVYDISAFSLPTAAIHHLQICYCKNPGASSARSSHISGCWRKSLDLISNLFEHQRRNAIARACGKRVRHLPVRDQLKTM